MSNLPALKIVRARRRTISLHILPDATLLVKAPYLVPVWTIRSFVEKNEDWIQKKLQALQKYPPSTNKQYKHGEQFLYLGNHYTITVGDYPSIQIQGTKLLFPQGIVFRMKKELESWYIAQAKKIITQQVEYYAKKMNVSYVSINFSDTKSKWGSCSHDNRLQFNWRLIMANILVLNYVVVHELVHTEVKNHSRSFWNQVRYHNPSYRQHLKWLKVYGDTLSFQ